MGGIIGGVVGAVGGLLGAKKQSDAAKSATRAQSRAAEGQLQLHRDIFEQTKENQEPFIQAGQRATAGLEFELGLGPRPENYLGFEKTGDYNFGLQQGIDAIDASAANRGNLFSGATLTDLNKFGQDYASLRRSEYLSRLGALSGQGMAGTQALANSANAFAQGAGSAMAGLGNAQAAGAIAQGNAFSSGLNAVTTGIGQIVGGIPGLAGGGSVPTLSPYGPGGFY